MVKPINKKWFGPAGENSTLKCQFHNGTESVNGWILRQKGTKRFDCTDGNVTKRCMLVDKAHDELLPGEMTITVKSDNGDVQQITKISSKKVTLSNGAATAWTFEQSDSDVLVEIEAVGVLGNRVETSITQDINSSFHWGSDAYLGLNDFTGVDPQVWWTVWMQQDGTQWTFVGDDMPDFDSIPGADSPDDGDYVNVTTNIVGFEGPYKAALVVGEGFAYALRNADGSSWTSEEQSAFDTALDGTGSPTITATSSITAGGAGDDFEGDEI